MHAFDRRTDRQTDRIPIAIPRLHSMQRGKNRAYYISIFMVLTQMTPCSFTSQPLRRDSPTALGVQCLMFTVYQPMT